MFFVLAEETTSLKYCLAAKQVLCFNKCNQKYGLYQKPADPKISKHLVAVTVIDAVPWKHTGQCQGSILSHTCLYLQSVSFY